MDIHAPESPIRSIKDILLHLGIVTIGILIALSLEGLVEWNHHNHLVREARENIRTEIEDNSRELTSHLSFTPDIQKEHETILKWLAQSAEARKNSKGSLSLSFRSAELSHTSWTTAQVAGALGLMNYSDVKRAAGLYQGQEEFVRLQARAEDAAIGAMTFFQSPDPTTASGGEVLSEKRKIQESLSALAVQQQVGLGLSKRYAAYLAQK